MRMPGRRFSRRPSFHLGLAGDAGPPWRPQLTRRGWTILSALGRRQISRVSNCPGPRFECRLGARRRCVAAWGASPTRRAQKHAAREAALIPRAHRSLCERDAPMSVSVRSTHAYASSSRTETRMAASLWTSRPLRRPSSGMLSRRPSRRINLKQRRCGARSTRTCHNYGTSAIAGFRATGVNVFEPATSRVVSGRPMTRQRPVSEQRPIETPQGPSSTSKSEMASVYRTSRASGDPMTALALLIGHGRPAATMGAGSVPAPSRV
jgi:hypothetical protein